MKLQLINLDPEDDYYSARDKLSWAKATRAVLVWPRRGRVLTRRLDLVLLQRHAQRQGVQLGLVSHDPAVLELARELGIPSFESPDRLVETGWRVAAQQSAEDRPPRRPVEQIRQLAAQRPDPAIALIKLPPPAGRFAAGLAIACALAVGLSMLPRAEIAVAPRRHTQIQPVRFVLDPELETPWRGSRVRSETVLLQLEGELRGPTTGRTQMPTTAASGAAVLTNLTSDRTAVPAGTGLRASASGVRFVTLEAVELPGAIGAQAPVPIRAAQPGPDGNQPAGAIDGVEGPIGFLLKVTNPQPTTGGEQESTLAVSGSDRSRLRRDLTAELLGRAAPAMAEPLTPGLFLVPDSVEISRVLEERYDQQVGAASPTLGVFLRIEFVGLVVDTETLEQAAAQLLAADLPGEELVIPASLQLRRDPAGDERLPSGEHALGYVAEQQIADRIDLEQLRQVAAGRWSASVPSLLAERFELGRPPLIRVRPAWYPWLPWLDIRLDVHWIWEAG